MQYFNDSIDKLVDSILDFIASKKLLELYPEISKLEDALEQIKHKCGSMTEKIIKRIKVEIKESITKEKIKRWINELAESFTKMDIQKKIDDKKETLFAVGFVEE